MPRHAPSVYDPGVQVDDQDLLCLHRNENLFIDTDWLQTLVRQSLERVSPVRYPDAASTPLRVALAESYDVEPDNVFVGNGADEVLSDLLGLVRHRFAAMATLDVCFKIYDLLADRFEYERRTIPGDTFSTGRIVAAADPGLSVVDSPNAITGNRLTWEELRPLAEPEGSFLIWDNVYGEFAGDSLPQDLPENVVFVRSFSKFYGLAGLRVGYCIGHARVIGELLQRKDAFNVNSVAQRAALAALAHQDQFSRAVQEAVSSRTELVSLLRARGFTSMNSGGNYVLVTHAELPAVVLQEELLKRRIAVRRFAGAPTDNYLRITVAPREAIDRLTTALDEILEHAEAARTATSS
jgi:histidinol-phosphate aminotransferase